MKNISAASPEQVFRAEFNRVEHWIESAGIRYQLEEPTDLHAPLIEPLCVKLYEAKHPDGILEVFDQVGIKRWIASSIHKVAMEEMNLPSTSDGADHMRQDWYITLRRIEENDFESMHGLTRRALVKRNILMMHGDTPIITDIGRKEMEHFETVTGGRPDLIPLEPSEEKVKSKPVAAKSASGLSEVWYQALQGMVAGSAGDIAKHWTNLHGQTTRALLKRGFVTSMASDDDSFVITEAGREAMKYYEHENKITSSSSVPDPKPVDSGVDDEEEDDVGAEDGDDTGDDTAAEVE